MMSKKKKLKLAVVSACAGSCAVEQLINLCPASLGLESHELQLTRDQREEKLEEEEDDELNSVFFQSAVLSCSLAMTADAGWWVKPRIPAWFDKFLLEVNDRESWYNALRMSKETFLWICKQLQPLLNKKVTRFRSPIPVPCRLGAALYRLTSGADLHIISEKFGIGVSSSQSCITDTVKAINQHFGSLICFPQEGDQMQQVVSGFVHKCELFNCVGAISRTSVQVMASSSSSSSSGLDCSSSISVQGVCDTSYRFLDVFCGNSQDENHAQSPGLVRIAELLSAAAAAAVPAEDCYYLIGDDGFPLLPWLLIRYQEDSDMPIMAESFNRRHALGVMHARTSFGILKDTFKILSKCVKHNVGFVPNLLRACCVLHNVLLERDEIPVDSLLQGMLSGAAAVAERNVGGGGICGNVEEALGLELRDELAEMLARRDF